MRYKARTKMFKRMRLISSKYVSTHSSNSVIERLLNNVKSR
jgi:hypothetical protein